MCGGPNSAIAGALCVRSRRRPPYRAAPVPKVHAPSFILCHRHHVTGQAYAASNRVSKPSSSMPGAPSVVPLPAPVHTNGAASDQGSRQQVLIAPLGPPGASRGPPIPCSRFRQVVIPRGARGTIHKQGCSSAPLRGRAVRFQVPSRALLRRRVESASVSSGPLTARAALRQRPNLSLSSPTAVHLGCAIAVAAVVRSSREKAALLAFSARVRQGPETLLLNQTSVSRFLLAAVAVAGELHDAKADPKRPRGWRFTQIIDGPRAELELSVRSSRHLGHR
ncbi:hypothetical protein NDU88_001196 [Pleurodeles waltl]|uniref:Uncharacterized protein n=1 Tax=Pleurodeles waltl TaxID=8319 RepID=A0AAV7M2F1_PLEWA|nr:hypothetical protein NDU88_001196 [Pleurodeles waltl]